MSIPTYATLPADDYVLFQELQSAAILPSLVEPGQNEIAKLYKERQREQRCNAMAPYADLLEEKLTAILQERKSDILKKLRECSGLDFTVELFSWNKIDYHESLTNMKAREAAMTTAELAEHREKRADQKYIVGLNNTMFGVRSDSLGWGWRYPVVPVENIFRDSDLAKRLSLVLGPNFFPFYRVTYADSEKKGEDGPHGFTILRKTLCVRYYPFGVNKKELDQLISVAKKVATRKADGKYVTQQIGDMPLGHMDLINTRPVVLKDEEDIYDVASESEFSEVRRDYGGCFCGCQDDGY